MTCFTNLPLYWVYKHRNWIDWYVAGGISPEFGLDPNSLAMPDSWHRALASQFAEAGLACALHLPFMGVEPCDPDRAKRAHARAQLQRGARIGAIYKTAHMIGHPYFRHKRDEDEKGRMKPEWLEYSLETWCELPDLSGAPLFLENTYECSMAPLTVLVSALHAARGITDPLTADVGICFDVGHWHIFAGLSAEKDLERWIDALIPYRLHLHLHDNTGQGDDHLGLGEGDIPFEALFAFLEARNKAVSASLEPHHIEAFIRCVTWLEKHPEAARRISWQGANVQALPVAEIQKTLAT